MRIKPIQANMTELSLADGTNILFSYETPVACFTYDHDGNSHLYKTDKKWSNTTTRHMNKWLGGSTVETMPQEYFDNLVKGV